MLWNIAVTGTVDTRDVAADGTKLDTIATNANVTPSWVPSSNPNYLTGTETIVAPASITTSIVGETVNVTFTPSTTSNIDNYLIFASVAGSDYSLISIVPPDDMASSMSIIDNSFVHQAHRHIEFMLLKMATTHLQEQVV